MSDALIAESQSVKVSRHISDHSTGQFKWRIFDHIAPLFLLKNSARTSFLNSAMIVISGLFLHIPGAIDKLLDPQLVNAVLAQVVVDDFFFDQFQNLPVIV